MESIFNPSAIAVIGASEEGYPWLQSLSKFPKVYAVNPTRKEVSGIPCYPSILDVPEKIDMVIISVPAPLVGGVIEECVKKGVSVATIFTAGYGEGGNKEREEELLNITKGKLRIIGPNCMGIYYPARKISFRPDLSMVPGNVAFLSQSGGHAITFSLLGESEGIRFSKVISYGNGIDLDSPDFLEYLIEDDETEIIAAYIEGVRDGKRLLKVLSSSKKPVIMLKGGGTEEGKKAALSHTGSIAGSPEIWDAVFSQTGVIKVESFDELLDTVLASMHFRGGERAGILTISGGQSVVLTDGCCREGLKVAELSGETRGKLQKIIHEPGTSVKNPVDLANAWGNPEIVERAIEILAGDKEVDFLIVEISAHFSAIYASFFDSNFHEKIIGAIKKAKETVKKPIFLILSPSSYEEERLRYKRELLKAGFPIFPSIQRVARAISNLL
jgi:acyl-CoA synthetase (NDP forming)